MAEGLKALPSTFRFTHNQSGEILRMMCSSQRSFTLLIDLDRASEGWDNLFKFHGRPSGIFAADEYLAGLEAHRGYVHHFSSVPYGAADTRRSQN